MTYSYTQISQYLSCPRRYKHRYLDGWKEKAIRLCSLEKNSFCSCDLIQRYNGTRQMNTYASKGPTARVGPIFWPTHDSATPWTVSFSD